MNAPRIKRFYKTVSVEEESGRFQVLLDGRKARTRGKNPLAAPAKALAGALAAEWDAQADYIDQNAMPLTGILSTGIDGGDEAAGQWRSEIVGYLKSDLICYRATEPAALVRRQAESWDGYIEFMCAEFGAALVATSGVIAVDQPQMAVDAVDKALSAQSPETLFALRLAAAIAGSAAMALALWRSAFPPEEIFEASRVDERFQEERWGEDGEAKARENRMRAEFMAISRFLRLLD